MQAHYAGALVEVSLMGIHWGVPKQGCCAGGFANVTWRCFTYESMEMCSLVQQDHGLGGVVRKLWSINTTWRAEASCRDLWAETCMLARMLVGDDSWSSWWHEVVNFGDIILWSTWRIWGIEEVRLGTLMQYRVHTFEYIYGCAWESDLMWRIDLRHLELWSCNDDDALVATLGNGLSRDLTTFYTWDLIGLWSRAAHGWWDRCIRVSLADLRDGTLQIWWRFLHGPGCGTSRVGLMRWSLHFEEMDFIHIWMIMLRYMRLIDMQHIDTKHHGQHVAEEMGVSSWT